MSWRHIQDSTPKARKDHECLLCGLTIPKGEIHIARSGFRDEGIDKFRMHPKCEEHTRKWDQGDWECHDAGEFREWISRMNAIAVAPPTQDSNEETK